MKQMYTTALGLLLTTTIGAQMAAAQGIVQQQFPTPAMPSSPAAGSYSPASTPSPIASPAPSSSPAASQSGFFGTHPKAKGTAMGAGVGMAAGAVSGLVTGQGFFRGAVIGAGTGAGIGFARATETMQNHPIVSDALTGTAAGWGLTMTARCDPWDLQAANRTAVVGGALGVATGLITNGLH